MRQIQAQATRPADAKGERNGRGRRNRMTLGLFFIGEWEGQLRGQHRFLSVRQCGAPPLWALGEQFVMVSP